MATSEPNAVLNTYNAKPRKTKTMITNLTSTAPGQPYTMLTKNCPFSHANQLLKKGMTYLGFNNECSISAH